MTEVGGWHEEGGSEEGEPGRVRCKEGEGEGGSAGGAGLGMHLQVRVGVKNRLLCSQGKNTCDGDAWKRKGKRIQRWKGGTGHAEEHQAPVALQGAGEDQGEGEGDEGEEAG